MRRIPPPAALPVKPPYIGVDVRTLTMPLTVDSHVDVFADRNGLPEWRVEYADEDGGCYVTVFAGPFAEKRARDYAAALKARTVAPIPTP